VTEVRLRPFRADDLSRVIAWRNDPEVRTGALWGPEPFGTIEAERWLRTVSENADPTRLTFAIELVEDGRLVGLTNLTRIHRRSGTAYFGVVIGEKDVWGRGVARRTVSLMLGHAVELRLRKILLEVAADNTRAVEIYRRAGFEVEGVLKRQVLRDGGHEDLLVMARFLAP
jgi:RimJ/RimL family protein N-acetyltransferase